MPCPYAMAGFHLRVFDDVNLRAENPSLRGFAKRDGYATFMGLKRPLQSHCLHPFTYLC
jgi:hypothetical protein